MARHNERHGHRSHERLTTDELQDREQNLLARLQRRSQGSPTEDSFQESEQDSLTRHDNERLQRQSDENPTDYTYQEREQYLVSRHHASLERQGDASFGEDSTRERAQDFMTSYQALQREKAASRAGSTREKVRQLMARHEGGLQRERDLSPTEDDVQVSTSIRTAQADVVLLDLVSDFYIY